MERENFLNLTDENQREQDLKWLYAYSGSNYKLILHGKSPDMRLLAGGIASAIEKAGEPARKSMKFRKIPTTVFSKRLLN